MNIGGENYSFTVNQMVEDDIGVWQKEGTILISVTWIGHEHNIIMKMENTRPAPWFRVYGKLHV